MHADAWVSQSAVTDPGPVGAAAIDELAADLAELRRASSRLLFHYRADGDFAENGVATERIAEIDTRYADAMFDRLLARGEPSLRRDRPASERFVGCCRDATVFLVAMARHKGIPARARVGFARYFEPGWLGDHVVAEVWDEPERRWRLVEAQMDESWTPVVDGVPVDWLDLTPDQFLTGPRAWAAARAGQIDPERCVVAPDLAEPATRSWPYLAHNAIHDLAALNKTEMVLWDAWGMMLNDNLAVDSALLDEICALTADPGADPTALASLGETEGLRVPAVVTSFDPMGGPPRRVDVGRAIAGKPAGVALSHGNQPPVASARGHVLISRRWKYAPRRGSTSPALTSR